MINNSETVGILGGMGPYASSSFLNKIIALTPVKKDWDHLRVVLDSNPHIPSRSRYLLYNEESPVEEMLESCIRLENYPVDFIVIPCNSASYFINKFEEKIKIPVLNIIKVTANVLSKQDANKNVAVLGGAITYQHKTYKTYIEKKGLNYIHYNNDIHKKVVELIEILKLNKKKQKANNIFNNILSELKSLYNIDVFILGCTELSFLKYKKFDFNIIDSSTELAKFVIKYAKK